MAERFCLHFIAKIKKGNNRLNLKFFWKVTMQQNMTQCISASETNHFFFAYNFTTCN